MDWSSILYAALGGGVGAALGSALVAFIQKLREKPTTVDKNDKLGAGLGGGLAGGLAVIGMTALPLFYKNMALPRIVPMDFSELSESMPIYDIIKEQSPKDYKRLIAPVDRAVRNNEVSQKTLDEMRAVLFKLTREKTKSATAETLRELEKQSIRQSQVYKQKKPSICTLMLNGEPYPAVSDILSVEDAKAEQEVMVKLFTNPPRASNLTSNLEEGKKLFEKIISQSVLDLAVANMRPAINGDSLNDTQNTLDHQKICDLSILISNEKVNLSDSDFINLADYLSSFE